MEYGATMKQINCIRYFGTLLEADSGHMCFGLGCPFNTCLLVNFCQPVNIQISHDPSLQQSRLNRYDGSAPLASTWENACDLILYSKMSPSVRYSILCKVSLPMSHLYFDTKADIFRTGLYSKCS